MTGLFIRKYHVAIYDENEEFINRITDALKSWYDNRIVIESYNNSNHMFQAVNMSKAENRPFDLAIFSSNDISKTKQMILKHTCPNLPVVLFKNEEKLQIDASKFLL
jgi:hypothetical protein